MNPIKIGILGLDASHVSTYTELINNTKHPAYVPGGKVVAAWAGGSPDWPLSEKMLKQYEAEARRNYGIDVYDDIEELLSKVDAVMILSPDGRKHLEIFRAMAGSRKPVYINKPLACSLAEARQIAALASKSGCPVFSSSSLRYSGAVRDAQSLPILAAELSGPTPREFGQPELFWYGIHLVETLFCLLGCSAESVSASGDDNFDLVTGHWRGGKTGIMHGDRKNYKGFTYSIKTEHEAQAGSIEVDDATNGSLVAAMLEFFKTGLTPVAIEETLEIIAYLEAANRSLRTGKAENVESP
jgi:hypothetical protein